MKANVAVTHSPGLTCTITGPPQVMHPNGLRQKGLLLSGCQCRLVVYFFLCSRNWYVGECCTDPLTRFWRDKSAQSHFTKHFKVPKFSQNRFKCFSKLIHSPGPDVTRVHSHRDKLGNKLRTNANKTLDSFVTSFIWNNVSCFICASMNSRINRCR